MFEVTFLDNNNTVQWTLQQCQKHFGVDEFEEIRQGYAPHIVAVEL